MPSIKETRQALGLTQVEMAAYLTVTPRTVKRWESEDIGPDDRLVQVRLATLEQKAAGRSSE